MKAKYSLRNDSRTVDQVANLAFLSSQANKKISSSDPSTYLPSLAIQHLKAQYVPLDQTLWSLDNFEKFVLQRRILLADAINQLLHSLSGEGSLWPTSSNVLLGIRIEAIEHDLRRLIEIRFTEAMGDQAWDQLVNINIKQTVASRVNQHIAAHPYDADKYNSLMAKLHECQFRDYFKIIQATNTWSMFQDVFGKVQELTKYSEDVIKARNFIAHNKDMDQVDRLAAETSLTWTERCLRHAALIQETE